MYASVIVKLQLQLQHRGGTTASVLQPSAFRRCQNRKETFRLRKFHDSRAAAPEAG